MADRMSKYMPLITAVIALVGVGFGAWIQHRSAVRLTGQQELLDQRTEAAAAFLKGQAEVDMAKELGDESQVLAVRTQIRDARTRIAVFGSKPVVESLAAYFEALGLDQCSGSRERLGLDIAIYQAMRKEIMPHDHEERIDDVTMGIVLWSCRPNL